MPGNDCQGRGMRKGKTMVMDGHLGDGKERIRDPKGAELIIQEISVLSPSPGSSVGPFRPPAPPQQLHQHPFPPHTEPCSNFKAFSSPSWVGRPRKGEGIIFSPVLGRGYKEGAGWKREKKWSLLK